METFIKSLPKVELHIHIEGSLEPELLFMLAKRNHIALPYDSPESLRQAYKFADLQSFLDLYYQGANTLINEQDFYDLTWAYIERCKEQNVIHTEIFFDPQTHTDRGIEFDTVVAGIYQALEDASYQFGISSNLIMCFLRHLSEEAAFETLQEAARHKDKIIAVGLDSSELGHPPEKFSRVFQKARELGFFTVAHAGEEGPAQNIVDAIELLGVSRIDHGVRCTDSEELVDYLIERKMPLTVCPLSNIELRVFNSMSEHNIVDLLRKGLCVTVNSDDPAYFGGYMTENLLAVHKALPMTKLELAQLTINAIDSSFISVANKLKFKELVWHYLAENHH
jgi:adenosine deaminase